MVNILHFDYDCLNNKGLRKELENRLNQLQGFNYQFFEGSEEGFKKCRRSLEQLLPEMDLLIIHPGAENQSAVFRYEKRYPHLKILFLVNDPPDYEKIKEHYKRIDEQAAIFEWKKYGDIIQCILDEYGETKN